MELLPLPLTPVKTISWLRGSVMLTSCKLCSRAPRTSMFALSMVLVFSDLRGYPDAVVQLGLRAAGKEEPLPAWETRGKPIIVGINVKNEGGLDAQLPRFVLLRHEVPKDLTAEGALQSHWDLMFQQDSSLLTLRLLELPQNSSEQQSFRVQRLPDHRIQYLDYEGPISGNRGHVACIARGWLSGNPETGTSGRSEWQLRSPALSAMIQFAPVPVGDSVDLVVLSWSLRK